MSNETNSNGRFDRIEANLEALTEQNKILGENASPRSLALKPRRNTNSIMSPG